MNINEAQLKDLVDKREAAERAVQGMPDGPLKEKAFEMIFQRLLDAEMRPVVKKTTAKKGTRRKEPQGQSASEKQTAKKSPAKSGPQAHLKELLGDGFFRDAKAIADIVSELRIRGHTYKQTGLSLTLTRMTRAKLLRRKLIPRKDGKKGSLFGYTKFSK